MSPREETYKRLAEIAIADFSDIVQGTTIIEGKLRLLITDGSYIDVWLSEKKRGSTLTTGSGEPSMGQFSDITTCRTGMLKD